MWFDRENEHRVVALPPNERDARATCEILGNIGISVTICGDMACLCREIDSGAGAVLLTNDALVLEGAAAALAAALRGQPKWSDLPVLLLASGGANSAVALAALEALPNVLVLERPVRLPTLLSAVRTALRSRDRQYELRDHLGALHRTEEALRVSEGRLRRLFDSDIIGVIYWDMDGRITGANDRFLKMVGYSREELTSGRVSWAEMTPPEYRDGDAFALAELAATGVDTPYEKEYIRKDGSRVPIFIGAAMLDELRHEGVAYVLDITERKRVEDALREDDRRKDEFLAMLGHELRNPLAAITTGLRLLRSPNAEQHEWVKQSLERQTRQVVALVDDLLDISRITRGKIQLRSEIVDLRTVAQGAVESITDLMVEKRHALTIACPDLPLPVLGDRTRLQQIIANLVNNAAKYTPDQGRIELKLERVGDEAVIWVKDNGLGIPADMQGSIFELFGQVDSAMHRPQQGLGIGLSLVRMLAELHGGSVGVASEGVGKGSTFTVRLPAVEATEELRASGEASPTADEDLFDILLVEDNHQAAQMLKIVLEERSHAVRVAESGGEAIRLARASRPDVVILDIGLPDMSGYEVAETLRREPGYAEMLIIAATGYGQERDRQRSREAGIDHHLVKPIEYETIAMLAREWRRTARSHGPAALPARRAATGPASEGRAARVLVIDDTRVIAKITQQMLQQEGHEVEIAFDGPSGISAARSFRPELILCDISLPGASGFEVLEAVKSEPGLEGVVVAAMTGYSEDEQKEATRKAGFDAHLVKPVSLAQLQSLIRQLSD